MDNILEILLYRLSNKGLSQVEISRLVRDVLNIFNGGGDFTVDIINRRLETIGWEREVVDDHTMELIICLLENNGEYEIIRQNLH